MKKSIRNIIILVCIGAVLGAAYFFIIASENPAQAGVLYKLGGDKISKVIIQNQYGSYQFEQQGGAWVVESGGTYRTNPEKMDLMLACLSEFSITRMLPEEKGEYGFETPQANVSVATSGGKDYSFLVGAEAIKGTSVYIKSNGQIMLTSTGMVSQLTGSLAAYRAKDILLVDPTNIRSIDYYVKGQKTLSLSDTDYQNWSMSYPFEAPARSVILNEYVSKLMNITIAGYVDSENPGGDTGLTDPASSMVLTDMAGISQKLDFGTVEGNLEYVRIGGESDIVKLYTVDIDFSELTPQGIMYVAPLDIDISDIQSVSIQAGETTDIFTLQHNEVKGEDKEDISVKLNGTDISLTDFVSVYFKVITLNADNYEPLKEGLPPGESEAVCTTTLLSGQQVTLSLNRRDADTLYMYLGGQMLTSGETKFYMPQSSLTELLYRLQSVKEKMS